MAKGIVGGGGIYAIRNTVTMKLYVGSAVNFSRRWKSHRSSLTLGKHHSPKLQRAWDKYGSDAFEMLVLEVVHDPNSLIQREQFWIDTSNAVSGGYNVCPNAGNSLGRKASSEARQQMSESRRNMSAETRAKMAAAHRGKKLSQQAKEMISAFHRGKAKSDEHRAKISAFRKSFVGWRHSEETKKKIGRSGDKNHMFGKSASDETRAKISASLVGNKNALGYKHSEETREKIRSAGTGRVHSDEAKAKIAAANLGKVFSAATRAKMSAAAKARACRQ